MSTPGVVKHSNVTNESDDQSASFASRNASLNLKKMVLTRSPSTLIAAPAGACPFGRSVVAALEKGETIACELRLAVTKMKNSHSHRLNVSLHYAPASDYN